MSKRLLAFALLIFCGLSYAQTTGGGGGTTGTNGITIQFQNGGAVIANFKKFAPINCAPPLTCTYANSVVSLTGSGGTAAAYFVSGNNGADGNPNTTIQSVYSNPVFSGGTIYINLTPNTTLSYLNDLFSNMAALSTPVVNFLPTASCTGLTGNAVTPGDTLALYVMEYDSYGSWKSSPVVQTLIPANAVCYTVTWSNPLYTGQNAGFTGSGSTFAVFAQQCVGACSTTATTPSISGTLQFSSGTSTGAAAAYTAVAPTTATTYFYGYTNASSTPLTLSQCTALTGSTTCPMAFTGPASDQGLEVGNTIIHVNPNGGLFVHFPTTIPWGSQLLMDGPVHSGEAELSNSAPNAIPVLENIYGSIVTDGGGANSIGDQISELLCLYDAGTATQTPQLLNCSSPVTSPVFTATTQDWQLLAPSPPYIYQARVASTYYYAGSRFSDQSAPENIWLVTTAGTSSSAGSFTTACGTAGTTTATDGTVSLLCIRKGQQWVGGSTYTPGTILTHAGQDYEVIIQGGGLTGGTPPAFNTNFGGCATTEASCAVGNATDGYQYQAISSSAQGPNLLVAPQFQLFGVECAGTVQICSAQNQTWLAFYTANQFQWSGCSGTSGVAPQAPGGTCAVNVSTTNTANVLKMTAAPAHSALPNTVGGADFIADGGACPSGRVCNATGSTYYANYTAGTPMGIIPLAMGENSASITAGHAITITGPPALGAACANPGCPPANAIGWYAGLTKTSGLELPQIPDGVNAYCGNGAPSAYVQNLPHHSLCAFGQTETIVNPVSSKPYFPMFNASEPVFNIGGITPLGSQAGNPLTGIALQGYGSVLGPWQEECGRTYNVGEPYAFLGFSSNGQEESGVNKVEQRDCMGGYFYGLGTGNQNSSVYIGHTSGQCQGYSLGTVIQDVSGFRIFQDQSTSACTQGTPFVTQFGVGIITSPQWNSAGLIGGIISGIECEVFMDCVQLRDAKGVTIQGVLASPVRPGLNMVHADYESRDFAITGSQFGSNCALLYDLFTPNSCTTGADTAIGMIGVGDIGGAASANEGIVSTSQNMTSLLRSSAVIGNVQFNNTGVLNWTGIAGQGGNVDTGISRIKAGLIGFGTGAQGSEAALITSGNTVTIPTTVTGIVATTPGTASQIASITFPNLAQTWNVHCHILYQQATAAGGIGLAAKLSAAPATAGLNMSGRVMTANAPVAETAASVAIAGTTATAVVTTSTVGALATTYDAYLDGGLAVAAGATNTLILGIYTVNASDAVSLLAGSTCSVTP